MVTRDDEPVRRQGSAHGFERVLAAQKGEFLGIEMQDSGLPQQRCKPFSTRRNPGHARIERDHLVCSIVDNGPGVPNDIAGKLFERFVHDGRRALLAGSVGLGLNIARSLMLEMEGDLVYERIRETTWFTFRLPLAREPSTAVLTASL